MSLMNRKPMRTSKGFKKAKNRPDWDSTVNDLSEFRATPEEVARRQEAHRSKNLELVRKSAIEKRIASARRQVLSDSTNRPTTNAFLREILYSDGDASRLLDDTSRALQVARDVFGDDAKKYKAVPAITTVGSDDEENLVYTRHTVPDGLIKTVNEPLTKLEKLSDSVMKKKALNETFSASGEDESSSDEEGEVDRPASGRGDHNVDITPAIPAYSSRVDLQRFQKLLEQEDISTIASEVSVQPVKGHEKVFLPPVSRQQAESELQQRPKQKSELKKSSKSKHQVPESTDLKSLLIKLDTELRSYESMHSIEEDSLSTQSTSDGSISTYTVTLINALHRMMSYFRQLQSTLAEERRQKAIKDQQILDLTNRADFLTTELINTQEQFHVVIDELNRVKTDQRQELDELKATVKQLSKGGVVHKITVDQPKQSKVLPTTSQPSPAPAMTLRQSTSPALVRIHQEFEGSPEQIRLLGQTGGDTETRPSSGTPMELRPSSATDHIPNLDIVDEEEMTVEQRIEQLRGDHQETLERFRKIGLELQKDNPKSAPTWLTENLV